MGFIKQMYKHLIDWNDYNIYRNILFFFKSNDLFLYLLKNLSKY